MTLTLGHETLPSTLSTLYIMWSMNLECLKLICPTNWEEMRLQENTLFDLTLPWGSGSHCPIRSTLCHLWTCKVWSCCVQQFRRCIYKKIHFLTIDIGTRSHETFPVPSTSCDICTCKVWSCYVQQFRRRCIYKKIHYFTFDLRVKVIKSRSQVILPSTLYIIRPMHLQIFKLICPMIK